MWRIFGKLLKRAIRNTLGLHAVLMVCLKILSFLDTACVACCLFLSTGSHHVCIQIHATCCCVPDAPQKPLVRKRARSGGADCVRVTRERSPSKAKGPRTADLHQPACTHKEHQILTTTEAASFASQFWDRTMHPTKASQQEFLATCIDIDLEKNVKHAERGVIRQRISHRTVEHVDKSAKRTFCIVSRFHAELSKLWRRTRQMRLLPPPSAL